MDNNQLQHWGIKGMKWGVRRYQNKDGTLTELGEKRYGRDAAEKGYGSYDESTGKYYTMKGKKGGRREDFDADVRRYVREDNEREKRVADDSANLARNLKNATDASIRNAKNNRPKMDLSNMTEKEMRDAINRAMLERQYNDMFAPQQSTKGRERVSQVLEVAGNALAITGSALGVALSIKALLGT